MRSAYLDEAMALARQGVGRTSPNPAVGAVLVRGNKVAGRGFHTWNGVKHAEIVALEQAGELARGADLYLTLEPCSHQGRTGPCADAIIQAGVARVVAAMADPNPKVGGQGFERLRQAGLRVEIAQEYEAEAEALNEPFVHAMRTGLPLVTLKAAVTLHGKIAAPEDNSGWITSERARAHVQQIRHLSDAILTGIGTVLADDCRLTDRTGLERGRPLLRIVADSTLRISPNAKIIQEAKGDLLVVTTSAAPAARREALEQLGVEVRVMDGPGGRVSLRQLVENLAAREFRSLMIEAGSKLNWAALEERIVDKIYFYYAPKILGGLASLPVAGGAGRRRRADAIRFQGVRLHSIPPDEFAVEANVVR